MCITDRLIWIVGNIRKGNRGVTIAQNNGARFFNLIQRTGCAGIPSSTTVGINQLINNKYKEYLSLSSSLNIESEKKLIQELESFGIETLNDLDKLINRVIQNYKILKNNTILGLCRDVMMLDDINKYFQLSFLGATNSWGVTNPETYTMLKQKYEEHEIDSIFSTNEIDIIEEGEE